MAQSLLGGALLAQGRFAEAEPLIVLGYEGMRKREAGIELLYRPQYYEALARVGDLYAQWGKPAQAAEWKQKLDAAAVPTRNITPVRRRPIAASVLQTKAPSNLAFALPVADATAAAAAVAPSAPWSKMGNQVASYVMGVDRAEIFRQPASAYVRSTRPQIVGIGGMMQTFAAADYQGRRVRCSGWIKTDNVGKGAQLLLRFDRQDGQTLAIDSMEDRPIKGTVDWTQATVVMDVPPEAAAIGIGFFLSGTGQMWVNDVQFDVVGNDVPVTRPVPKSVPATGK